jgi:hypothetical protein
MRHPMVIRIRYLAVFLPLLASCSTTLYSAKFRQPQHHAQLDRKDPFLKVHTTEGEVFVLSDWEIDEKEKRVEGAGIHYDVNRKVTARGLQKVPLAQVVMLETNRPEQVKAYRQFVVLAVMTTATIGLTLFCVLAQGACFGF